MYNQLTRLDTITTLLNIEVPSDALINRAMDVRSSLMVFLAVHIRHEAVRFGLLGKTA
jgi:hypothetical protein